MSNQREYLLVVFNSNRTRLELQREENLWNLFKLIVRHFSSHRLLCLIESLINLFIGDFNQIVVRYYQHEVSIVTKE